MKLKGLYRKIRHNHLLMMVICCVAPLILLIGATYLFGISRSYLYWSILLLCPLMHFFMMKDMHKKEGKSDEGGKCH